MYVSDVLSSVVINLTDDTSCSANKHSEHKIAATPISNTKTITSKNHPEPL